LVGLITIKDIDNQLEYPYANKDQNGRLIVGAGVGVGEDTMERVAALVEAGVDIIAVDSAHGHSKGVLNKISEIRNGFPDLDIVGGNIVTADAAEALINAGANVLKVGVGLVLSVQPELLQVLVFLSYLQFITFTKKLKNIM
jgi:IMP dehydrogenase